MEGKRPRVWAVKIARQILAPLFGAVATEADVRAMAEIIDKEFPVEELCNALDTALAVIQDPKTTCDFPSLYFTLAKARRREE